MILFSNLSEASWSLCLELKGGPSLVQKHNYRQRISRFSNYVVILRIKNFFMSIDIYNNYKKKIDISNRKYFFKKKSLFGAGLIFTRKCLSFNFLTHAIAFIL